MGFTAVAVVGGLVLGLVFGGRPSNLGRQPLRWWPALVLGILLQAAAEILDLRESVGLALVYASYGCLIVFAVRNLRLVGMPIVLLGLVLNTLVIGLNGGMPVREEAILAAGDLRPDEIDTVDFGAKRHLEDDSDRLAFLGDVIPVRLTREVLSFGDLLLAFGIANVLFRLLRPAGAHGAVGRRGAVERTTGADTDGSVIDSDEARDPVVRIGSAG
jgi:hypothetical protein